MNVFGLIMALIGVVCAFIAIGLLARLCLLHIRFERQERERQAEWTRQFARGLTSKKYPEWKEEGR